MKLVTFQVLEGVDKGRVFKDLAIPVSIGREEGNLMRLNDERVSRFHAKVQIEDADIILTDLDSTNGTRVNGQPVQIRRLRPGDQITIGRSMLLFGTLEEIAARRTAKSPASQVVEPSHTHAGDLSNDDLGFDLNLNMEDLAVDADEIPWGGTDADRPPLPLKMSAAQSARLVEMLDFLHRGLTKSLEKIESSEDRPMQVQINFNEWQILQTVQLFLAKYVREVSDPEGTREG